MVAFLCSVAPVALHTPDKVGMAFPKSGDQKSPAPVYDCGTLGIVNFGLANASNVPSGMNTSTGPIPKLAAELGGKNIVIVHRTDPDGLALYRSVADSLDDLDIPYRSVAVQQWASLNTEELKKGIGTDWLLAAEEENEKWAGMIEI